MERRCCVPAGLAPNSPGAAKPDSYMKQLAVTRDIAGLDVLLSLEFKVEIRGGGGGEDRFPRSLVLSRGRPGGKGGRRKGYFFFRVAARLRCAGCVGLVCVVVSLVWESVLITEAVVVRSRSHWGLG